MRQKVVWGLVWGGLVGLMLLLAGCLPASPPPPEAAHASSPPAASDLAQLCAHNVGAPRVERVSEHVWMAIGYDMANTILITTADGLVVVDSGSSPERARRVKQAFREAGVAVEPVQALIYTHSHADHVGGALEWAPPEAQIWATDSLATHLFKQYSRFLPAERARAGRQLGSHVPLAALPCSSIGDRTGLTEPRSAGLLLPTQTFRGRHTLVIGGVEMVLEEAPGETEDQLLVWLPQDRTLLCGDNFYWAFPNLYTIRGTSPRPVDGWINSLDRMRALKPAHLAPQHTRPIQGEMEISQALTDYRDAIQWLRDEVVRRANQGQDLDTIAQEVRLPARLAHKPYLREVYGQLDWSARAIYTNNLGWFDGRPERLYPTPTPLAAAREVELLGGPARVLELARQALAGGDPAWAAHLLAKLGDSRLAEGPQAQERQALLAQALRDQANQVLNSNGRAYLLESAHELHHGLELPPLPPPNPRLVAAMPLEIMLDNLVIRLDPEASQLVHAALVLVFPDVQRRYVLTVRWGVAELVQGEALPGTPAPVAVWTMASQDFRRLILGVEGPLALRAAGKIKVEGSFLNALGLLKLFRSPRGGQAANG